MYITKKFFQNFFWTTLLFCGLFILGELLSRFYVFLNYSKNSGQPLLQIILLHYLTMLPRIYHLLSTYIIFFAGLLTLMQMENSRELHVMAASGLSWSKVTRPILWGAFFLGLLNAWNLEVVLPHWPFQQIVTKMEPYLRPLPLVDRKGNIFYVHRYLPQSGILQSSSQFPFAALLLLRNKENKVIALISAKRGKWIADKKFWLLQQVWMKSCAPQGLETTPPRFLETFSFFTDLRPEDLQSVSGMKEDYLGLSALWSRYHRRGVARIKVKFFSRLGFFFQPLLLLYLGMALYLLGQGHGLLRFAIATLAGSAFLVAVFICEAIAQQSTASPLFSLSLPYFSCLLLASWLWERDKRRHPRK